MESLDAAVEMTAYLVHRPMSPGKSSGAAPEDGITLVAAEFDRGAKRQPPPAAAEYFPKGYRSLVCAEVPRASHLPFTGCGEVTPEPRSRAATNPSLRPSRDEGSREF